MANSLLNRLAQFRRGFKRQSSKTVAPTPTPFQQLRSNDILIASYPRSGNTWLRYLIADVILQNADNKTSTELPVHVDQIIPDLDRGDSLDTGKEFAPRRVLKTHHNCVPAFKKAIVIFRNPVDSLTSYFHFHLRYENLKPFTEIGIDQFCLQRFPDWKAHLESFHQAHQNRLCDCLFLKYEQLHHTPAIQLSTAMRFMGFPHTREQCDIAVDNHHFAKHAQHENPKPGTQERFFRKGEIGSGAGELQASTLAAIDEQHTQLLNSISVTH